MNIKETDIFIKSDLVHSINIATNEVITLRKQLEKYISKHREFKNTFEPVRVDEKAPLIIRMMQNVTTFIRVGPMAAVAGAIADLILDKLQDHGSESSIVENGGEVCAISKRDIIIGVLAGSSSLSGKIGFKLVQNKDFPFGLGTSSRGGRGFSFGYADAATVISTNATIGDAAATFVGNKIMGEDIEKSVQDGLEAAESLEKIRGALIIRGKYAGVTGKIPKLIKIKGDLNKLLKKKYEYKLDKDYIIL